MIRAAKPLRMVDQDMKRRPLDGMRAAGAGTPAQQKFVYESLILRVVCQPVRNVVRMRGDGLDVWRAFISCS